MTDLELTKACADAMGLEVAEQLGGMRFLNTQYESSLYDPLANDAQAMALLKKFRFSVDDANNGDWFVVGIGGAQAENPDLNRAICECVAQLQCQAREREKK